LNQSMRDTYANIKTSLPNCQMLKSEMIIKKEQVGVRKNGEAIYDFKLNVDFWKSIGKPINVVLDEAHTMFNARKSMSKVNIIMTDWLALIRRVLGQAESGYGELVLISQLANRIDIIAREMATNVRWHVMHYSKTCMKCGYTWQEDSDSPEPIWACESCGCFKIKKHSHYCEVWHFGSMQAYETYRSFGMSTFHMHYIISDIEKYFTLYDTFSWESLTSTLYE